MGWEVNQTKHNSCCRVPLAGPAALRVGGGGEGWGEEGAHTHPATDRKIQSVSFNESMWSWGQTTTNTFFLMFYWVIEVFGLPHNL